MWAVCLTAHLTLKAICILGDYGTAQSGNGAVVFALRSLTTTVANSGWTTMNVAGVNFTRSSATFSNSNDATVGQTIWSWTTSSNPFGTTVGATKVVTFT